MGDFNFDNKKETAKIDPSYNDIWVNFNDISTNPGHTMKKSN